MRVVVVLLLINAKQRYATPLFCRWRRSKCLIRDVAHAQNATVVVAHALYDVLPNACCVRSMICRKMSRRARKNVRVVNRCRHAVKCERRRTRGEVLPCLPNGKGANRRRAVRARRVHAVMCLYIDIKACVRVVLPRALSMRVVMSRRYSFARVKTAHLPRTPSLRVGAQRWRTTPTPALQKPSDVFHYCACELLIMMMTMSKCRKFSSRRGKERVTFIVRF